MNNITKSRLLSIVVIILMIANIATLAMFWIKRDHEKMPPPQQQNGGPFAFLIKELAFDSAQVIAYAKLRDEHKSEVESYRNAINNAKDSLFALLKQPAANEDVLRNALSHVGEKEKMFNQFIFLHFKKVRALCNVTQQSKFDKVIQQAIRMGQAGLQKQGFPPRERLPHGDRPPPRNEEGQEPPRDNEHGGYKPPPPSDQHPPQ